MEIVGLLILIAATGFIVRALPIWRTRSPRSVNAVGAIVLFAAAVLLAVRVGSGDVQVHYFLGMIGYTLMCAMMVNSAVNNKPL